MSKRVTVLAVDACECERWMVTLGEGGKPVLHYWDGLDWEPDSIDRCGACGHVCRVIELDLGKDPAALLERAATYPCELVGQRALLGHQADKRMVKQMDDARKLDAAAEVLKARGD